VRNDVKEGGAQNWGSTNLYLQWGVKEESRTPKKGVKQETSQEAYYHNEESLKEGGR